MASIQCWFSKICGKKEEICKNCLELNNCVRYNQMYFLTVDAGIPGMLPVNHQLEKPKDVSSPDWEVYQNLYSLDLDKLVLEGRSIVIESTKCGNGKTTWAQRLLLKYLTTKLGKLRPGYFLSIPQALYEIKNSINTGKQLPYEEIFTEVPLLVLDDVGHKVYSEYEETWLLRVLSLRQLKGLSTIYTMNSGERVINGKKYNLIGLIGDRLFSRIYTASTHYFLAEEDKRGLTT